MSTSVLGVCLDPLTYESVNRRIFDWVRENRSHYICVANVHMLMETYDSAEFRKVVNNADLVTPDGMPLVWIMRLRGAYRQQRVYGPTLMLHVLEVAARDRVPVGFYGGAAQTLELLAKRLQARYEALNVVFTYSPPYRDLTVEEDLNIVENINRSGARILFIGLGCPKQEIWMAAHRGKVNAVMLGVGAAFDFHAGTKPQAPAWMQTLGLEWFFRLLAEPRRLWRRYILHNPRFVFLAIADLLGWLKVD